MSHNVHPITMRYVRIHVNLAPDIATRVADRLLETAKAIEKDDNEVSFQIMTMVTQINESIGRREERIAEEKEHVLQD